MGFVEAVKTCFKKYATFSGRASRSEYWHYVKFHLFAGLTISVIFGSGSSLIGNIIGLILLVPNFSVSVRRFHDIDKSGWLALYMYLSVFAGALPFFITGLDIPILNSLLPDDGLSAIFSIFVVSFIICIVVASYWIRLLSRKGTVGDNRFGPDPLQPK